MRSIRTSNNNLWGSWWEDITSQVKEESDGNKSAPPVAKTFDLPEKASSCGKNGEPAATQATTRCARTDGRSWRCTRQSVEGKKYCPKHMHRGCRKRRLTEASTTDAPTKLKAQAEVHHKKRPRSPVSTLVPPSPPEVSSEEAAAPADLIDPIVEMEPMSAGVISSDLSFDGLDLSYISTLADEILDTCPYLVNMYDCIV